jgi:hypothetical protein
VKKYTRDDALRSMATRWVREAESHERMAGSINTFYNKAERDVLRMHATAKRAAAKELLDELCKVRR